MSAYIDASAVVEEITAADSAKIWKNVFLKRCQLGEKVNVGDQTRAEDSVFDDFVNIQRNNLLYASHLGRHTYTGKNLTMWHAKVGAFCSISWNVGIGGANHDYKKLTTHAFLYSPHMGLMGDNEPGYDRFTEPCEIGNDVWIGANAVICRNVKIGDGAVVGAGAVVTKDVPPYTIAAGVPAKPIKKRFDDKTIERLLNIKWWEFSDEIIKENFSLFNAEPTEEILSKLEELKATTKTQHD